MLYLIIYILYRTTSDFIIFVRNYCKHKKKKTISRNLDKKNNDGQSSISDGKMHLKKKCNYLIFQELFSRSRALSDGIPIENKIFLQQRVDKTLLSM